MYFIRFKKKENYFPLNKVSLFIFIVCLAQNRNETELDRMIRSYKSTCEEFGRLIIILIPLCEIEFEKKSCLS
jgi:hypothetical protein